MPANKTKYGQERQKRINNLLVKFIVKVNQYFDESAIFKSHLWTESEICGYRQ